MKNSIIVGPLLGFEDGDYYSVCVLLEPGLSPSLRLGGPAQSLAFTKAATVGGNEFWRAEIQLPASATPQSVSYSIEAGGNVLADQHDRNSWSFYVPGVGEQPLIGYGSCNGFSSGKLARDTDRPYLLWEKMAEQHGKAPFSLLLMGGDQVYADEIWESKRCPSLVKWSELNWKRQAEAKVTATMTKEIAAFYDWLYTVRWTDKSMSLMLASIPTVMMWDDHDIFDGWGSYPKERQECEVFQEVFKHAARVFDVFQLRCSTRNRLSSGGNHRTLRLRFRDYHVLVLDNRSERTIERVMSEENWQDVKGWLGGPECQTTRNLLVMAGVPVVYRSFATVEAVLDTTPWHEEIEDDVHDHWSSRSHSAERMRLAMVLLNFVEGHTGSKVVVLSGDVHVGALGQLWDSAREVGVTQVIASGIVHPPPTLFQWAGIQLMTSDTPDALGDGDVTVEMLTPFGSPKYLRTRNFATLKTGTDSKIWVNWVCENEHWKPSFAIG